MFSVEMNHNSNNSTFNWSGPYERVDGDEIINIEGMNLSYQNDKNTRISENLRKRIQAAKIERELIEKRYHPNAILANINKNKLNVKKVWEKDNLFDKYYGKRGEVWTEGEGTAKGGKRKTKRRLQKKRKTSKARKH